MSPPVTGSFVLLGPVTDGSARLRLALEELGHRVELHEDAWQGVAQALASDVDAVVLGRRLTDGSPAELCASLRARPQTQDLLLVFEGARGEILERVEAWRAGASEVLDPELPREELDARVLALLRERQHGRSVRAEARRLQTLLDSLTDAVLVIGADGMIEVANRGAFRLLHLDPDILRLRSVAQILNTIGVSKETIDRVLTAEEALVEEIDALVGGQERTLRVRCQRLPDLAGHPPSWAAVLRDVTVQREHERLKADFHSMIAHDLRSPLSVIRGYLQLLRETPGEDLRDELIDGIERKTEDVSRLLDDFLDLSQLDAGFLRLDFGPLDVAEVLEECRQDLEVLARQRGLELVVEVDPAAELVPLQADARRVRQVVQNLVTNAIKYGGQGELVRMVAALTSDGLRIEIVDQGPGIPPEEQSQVFDRYHRSKTGRMDVQGNGLGLVIVRRIVEAHGGQVGVESDAGEGATFWFELPADLSKAHQFSAPVEEIEI